MDSFFKFLKFLLKGALYLFACLGLMSFLVLAILGVLGYKAMDTLSDKVSHFEAELKDNMDGFSDKKPYFKVMPEPGIMTIDFRQTIVDEAQLGPAQFLSGKRMMTVFELVSAIDFAAQDDRIHAIYAEIGGDHIGIANIQEIRDAIIRFNEAGKFSMIYSSSIGEGGSGTQSYYLSTAFNEIWLQHMGAVNLVGMMSATPFARGALDKIGIVPDIHHRGKYKSAPNTYTEYDFTAEQREVMEDVLQRITTQELKGLKAQRPQMPLNTLMLYNNGPYLAPQALTKKLIDHIGFEDEARKHIKSKYGDKASFIEFENYYQLKHKEIFDKKKPKVAVIVAEGTIVSDHSSEPNYQKDVVSPNALEKQFKRAATDDSIKAVIFRVNSPGGSPIASEQIRHHIQEYKKTGKPMIVSMGNYAASGGYWISMDGDKIIAEPATLTGSIGVFAGKFSTEGFWKKLGISWGLIGIGDNSTFFTHLKPYSETEQSRLNEQLDHIYQYFVSSVAKARGMTESKTSLYAEGRVWTGEEALKIGLVDGMGGYDVAKDEVFKLLGIDAADQKNFIYVDLKPKANPFNFFIEFLNVQLQSQQVINMLWPALRYTDILQELDGTGITSKIDSIL